MTDRTRPSATGATGVARAPTFPRRDSAGRIVGVPDMLAGVAFWLVVGVVALVAIDGIFALLGIGTFGSISGWLAGILMVWMFTEEFRAWQGVPARIAVALVGALLGLLAGVVLSSVLTRLPNVANGAISVAVAGVIYAVVWFVGIRWLADRLGEG